MSVSATYNLFVGLLMIAYGTFIFVPAWLRWKRNLALARKGVKTTGRYQGDSQVGFLLEADKQITFSTWRTTVRRSNIGDELPVLYDPAQPHRAEVLTRSALWHIPLSHIMLAVTSFLAAVLMWRGINLALVVLILAIAGPLSSICACFVLYALYPPARLGRFNMQNTSADPASSFEIFPGPGKIYSRQHRRLRRQQDWKVQPHNQESEVSTAEEAIPPTPPKRRAEREQLLRNMIEHYP